MRPKNNAACGPRVKSAVAGKTPTKNSESHLTLGNVPGADAELHRMKSRDESRKGGGRDEDSKERRGMSSAGLPKTVLPGGDLMAPYAPAGAKRIKCFNFTCVLF
ncbi:hypothetical protein BaRGS_00029398 [Batillaria attramentaria]|uniref:Uncharacterized protein n=1 Tax=Batillaria attramentaria TaxID=370345 RepID=A0ABD0JXL6_9CAEN